MCQAYFPTHSRLYCKEVNKLKQTKQLTTILKMLKQAEIQPAAKPLKMHQQASLHEPIPFTVFITATENHCNRLLAFDLKQTLRFDF
jgi:hypothetical protein